MAVVEASSHWQAALQRELLDERTRVLQFDSLAQPRNRRFDSLLALVVELRSAHDELVRQLDELRRRSPRLRIIVLCEEPDLLFEASLLELGVSCVVRADISSRMLARLCR